MSFDNHLNPRSRYSSKKATDGGLCGRMQMSFRVLYNKNWVIIYWSS